jgi:uncharacterized membrane protein YuzA (DUF378 family)
VKSPKRIGAVLLAGFFAFAPPGTLIFSFVIILAFIGKRRIIVAGAVVLIGIAATWLMVRRRRVRNKRDVDRPQY